jgi:H+/Cl- antiporter ClcA
MLIEVLRLGEKLSQKLRLWNPLKGIIGGMLLIILTLFLSTNYLGLGLDTIEKCLKGDDVPWYAFFIKMLFTSITLSFGGSGGIVTPIFFIGAGAGITFASFLGWETAVFASIGFVSLLAGAANTPIAASIMAVEIFGPSVAPYACIACVISFLMTGHRSVYPSQIISMKKSRSIDVKMGMEIHKAQVEYYPRKKSFISVIKVKTKNILELINKPRP